MIVLKQKLNTRNCFESIETNDILAVSRLLCLLDIMDIEDQDVEGN